MRGIRTGLLDSIPKCQSYLAKMTFNSLEFEFYPVALLDNVCDSGSNLEKLMLNASLNIIRPHLESLFVKPTCIDHS